MNVEIGAEAAQFPEKEYINGIAVAVWASPLWPLASVRATVRDRRVIIHFHLVSRAWDFLGSFKIFSRHIQDLQ
jgi:hypothetical protein